MCPHRFLSPGNSRNGVIVSLRRYHSIPNICAKLQLEQWLKKNKTPLFSYDPYKERKKRSLRSFFKRRIATAFAPISFVETFVCHFLLRHRSKLFYQRHHPSSTDTEIGYRTRLLRLLMPNIASIRIFYVRGILHATFTTFKTFHRYLAC